MVVPLVRLTGLPFSSRSVAKRNGGLSATADKHTLETSYAGSLKNWLLRELETKRERKVHQDQYRIHNSNSEANALEAGLRRTAADASNKRQHNL
jgi:hypothetical protein